MNKVYAMLVVHLELNEMTVSGTQLDLKGLGSAVRRNLENMPMNGPQMRILSVETPTKDWQIGAQLALGLPFKEPEEVAQ